MLGERDMWYILINIAKLLSKEVVAVYNTLDVGMPLLLLVKNTTN